MSVTVDGRQSLVANVPWVRPYKNPDGCRNGIDQWNTQTPNDGNALQSRVPMYGNQIGKSHERDTMTKRQEK